MRFKVRELGELLGLCCQVLGDVKEGLYWFQEQVPPRRGATALNVYKFSKSRAGANIEVGWARSRKRFIFCNRQQTQWPRVESCFELGTAARDARLEVGPPAETARLPTLLHYRTLTGRFQNEPLALGPSKRVLYILVRATR